MFYSVLVSGIQTVTEFLFLRSEGCQSVCSAGTYVVCGSLNSN